MIFEIKYLNESSSINGEKFPVREIDGFPDHYFISDGKSHVGGGKLLRKYCVKPLYNVYDSETDKKISFYSDAEFIEYANKEQEFYEAHDFILFTVPQCKSYITNWCDNLTILK